MTVDQLFGFTMSAALGLSAIAISFAMVIFVAAAIEQFFKIW